MGRMSEIIEEVKRKKTLQALDRVISEQLEGVYQEIADENNFRIHDKLGDGILFSAGRDCVCDNGHAVMIGVDVIDYRRSQILVKAGKGAKDRIVYISNDAAVALAKYLRKRHKTNERQIFLAEKERCRRKPISVRAVQKRVEYYARESGVSVTCHRLRHTMATQLLNANADIVSIQEILGHSKIKTTQRYSKLLNLKIQRDYFNTMEVVMEKRSVHQLE